MEQKVKKFFPQEAKPSVPKAATKGRSSFQAARKIPDFHIGTPASSCVSMRELFDNYVSETYSNITDEQRQKLWQDVSLRMLSEPSERLEDIINSYLSI